MRVCSDSDVAVLLELEELLSVVADAFQRQGRGEVERPERPHFPVGTGVDGDESLGTGLTMPAYLHGDETYATKLASVHPENPPDRPTIHAQVLLTDARTGEPAALFAGERITNARTGCIGGVAVECLADEPVTLGVVGAGAQARWQTRAIDAAVDVASVRIYSPSDSRRVCARDLQERGIDARAVNAPGVAVGAYTAETQELHPNVVERADRLYADVPAEAVETGDLLAADHDEPTPLSAVLRGDDPRVRSDEVVLVKSVGTVVLDAAAGRYLLDAAWEADRGDHVTL